MLITLLNVGKVASFLFDDTASVIGSKIKIKNQCGVTAECFLG